VSMICGVLAPSRGRVTIDDADVHGDPFVAKAKLGLVPQELALYDELTAVQNLRFVGALYGLAGSRLAERIGWALDTVGLTARGRDGVGTYSGGMKRRLNLAAGLLHEPRLLVLDEPTVGVDAQSRYHIFETLRALKAGGMTIVYTSHYLEEVEALCDRVAIIDHGAVVASGGIGDLIAAHGAKRIVIELSGEPAALDAATIAAARHALTDRYASTLRVLPHAGLAPVISAIERAGASVARVEARGANLETAFLALTGHAPRDGS
jgi:ABC-2 type transport system ATP-binding protein